MDMTRPTFWNTKNQGKNITFQLATLESNEVFSIWKDYNIKQDLTTNLLPQAQDPNGTIIKFPIKEGTLRGTDGFSRDIKDVKYMKQAAFKQVYPYLTRKSGFQRRIVVDGATYIYEFPITAENKLKSLIQTLASAGQNPLGYRFQMLYNAAAPPLDKYNVVLVGPATPQPGMAPTPAVGHIDGTVTGAFGLATPALKGVAHSDVRGTVVTANVIPEQHQHVLTQIVQFPTTFSQLQFDAVCKENIPGVTAELIAAMWSSYKAQKRIL